MNTLPQSERGVTLIEMMIALAVLFVFMLMAMPGFQSAIQNGQIRTSAEAVVNGLQMARAEAVRRNAQVQLQLTNQIAGAALAGGTDWAIVADDGSTPGTPNFAIAIQAQTGQVGSTSTRIGTKTVTDFSTAAAAGAGLPGAITFNSLGRLVGTSISQIDVVHASNANARRLSIVLTPGGQIRLCDPALSLANNAQGCA